ncbi:PEGA domain-containing protein [bacterium]|nr:PEGA domain-containing protein [bacterium]
MRKRFLALVVLGLFLLPSIIFSAEPELKTIIIEPVQADFKVEVWTDKGNNASYKVGETITIYFKLTQDAYVYIWDINANGEVRLILPNGYRQDNFFRANIVHSIPAPTDKYTLRVAPPYGREVIHVLASRVPVNVLEGYRKDLSRDPFPLIHEAPETFTDKVRRNIEIVPTPTQPVQWTTANTIFYVVSEGVIVPPPGPSQALGRLVVESKPSGASIFIDGRFLGYTPYTGDVSVGRHSIRLELSGYQTYETTVNITPNKTTKVSVTLKLIPYYQGTLYITSNPSSAEVYVNGERKGRTPIKIDKLKPGRYQITVIKAGYETFVQYYEVVAGETRNIFVQLYPIR